MIVAGLWCDMYTSLLPAQCVRLSNANNLSSRCRRQPLATVVKVISLPFSISQPPGSHTQQSSQNVMFMEQIFFSDASIQFIVEQVQMYVCAHMSIVSHPPFASLLKAMFPHTVCLWGASVNAKQKPRRCNSASPHRNVNGTCAYLQLSLLHSSSLTWFYPSRIPASEQESFLSASPSSLMPMLCLHQKHSSSPHNQRRFLSAHSQMLPQWGKSTKF